jgi:hypothetical protein
MPVLMTEILNLTNRWLLKQMCEATDGNISEITSVP